MCVRKEQLSLSENNFCVRRIKKTCSRGFRIRFFGILFCVCIVRFQHIKVIVFDSDDMRIARISMCWVPVLVFLVVGKLPLLQSFRKMRVF